MSDPNAAVGGVDVVDVVDAVDVVVVGGGAAGAAAALSAAAGGRRVLLVVKGALGDGATAWAKGGLAAVLDPHDSTAEHVHDTLVAGAGLCDPAVVTRVVHQAPPLVRRLELLGARFDRSGGRLALGREGGHRHPRIVHAGGDATGAELTRALVVTLGTSSVAVREHVTVSDVLLDEAGQAAGVDLLTAHGERQRVLARAVVLATGGVGQVYATTSNPPCATGDGLVLALRAGARVQDAELVQFHPTALWLPTGRVEGHQPLITEALRGAGAVLRDDRGRRVMSGVHPQADLAPRDVVSAAIHATLRTRGIDHVFLDATGIDRATLERSFPRVLAACRGVGVDPGRDPIPVVPAAHYHCGGVRAGLDGRTDVVGLHAIGEVARTGMHGANRLASNSLTEALLTGFRAGELLARRLPDRRGSVRPAPAPAAVGTDAVPALRRAMDEHAGVLRNAAGLEELLARLARTPSEDAPARTPAQVEATSLRLVAQLVATAARTRAESRGCHRRSDAPTSRQRWQTTVSLTWEDGAVRAAAGTHGAAA